MRIQYIIIFYLLITITDTYAQRGFYHYQSEDFGFSFNCPNGWLYKPDTAFSESTPATIDRFHGSFVPLDPAELKFYEDCYDGIIFHVEIIPRSLEESLLQDGLYSKANRKYYAKYQFMPSDSLEAETIKGIGWTGIHHVNTCRIRCKEDDVSPVVEGCEVFYFSNDKVTVNFSTTGQTLTSEVYEMIVKSFRFR